LNRKIFNPKNLDLRNLDQKPESGVPSSTTRRDRFLAVRYDGVIPKRGVLQPRESLP
jgi:hypothetical protein